MSRLRWQPWAALALSLYGLGVSIYLTITHFQHHLLACASNSFVNCLKVTTSPQSELLGVPVAVLGLFFFVPMVALNLPAAWRTSARWVHLVRLACTVVAMGMVLWLISAELFIIHSICEWCTTVHVATVLLFVLVVTTAPIVLADGYGTLGPEADGADIDGAEDGEYAHH